MKRLTPSSDNNKLRKLRPSLKPSPDKAFQSGGIFTKKGPILPLPETPINPDKFFSGGGDSPLFREDPGGFSIFLLPVVRSCTALWPLSNMQQIVSNGR